MVILNILTISVVLLLVVVLAVNLIRTLRALMSTARVLAQIDAGFKVIQSQTDPLNGAVADVNVALETIEKGMKSINKHLQEADKKLQPVSGD